MRDIRNITQLDPDLFKSKIEDIERSLEKCGQAKEWHLSPNMVKALYDHFSATKPRVLVELYTISGVPLDANRWTSAGAMLLTDGGFRPA